MNTKNKRLFFGVEIRAPWPEALPEGRVLDQKDRHLTLAFIGDTDVEALLAKLSTIPKPDYRIGRIAIFDKTLFLPPKHPRVVSWHMDFLEDDRLKNYQKHLSSWLDKEGYPIREHKQGFVPHVTISRLPFKQDAWEKAFYKLPAVAANIHLYESLGYSKYDSLWKINIPPPFEEIDHTADVAFFIRGESLINVYKNASWALCFDFPEMLSFIPEKSKIDSLDDVIENLNKIISAADKEIGCPFKAVSYHGGIEEEDELLKWEMIIDV